MNRTVKVSRIAKKRLDKLQKKQKQWTNAVIKQLENPENDAEYLKSVTDPLKGDLKGFRKFKSSSLGVRVIFEIVPTNNMEEIRLLAIENGEDENDLVQGSEMINVIGTGDRKDVYKIGNKEAKRRETGRNKLRAKHGKRLTSNDYFVSKGQLKQKPKDYMNKKGDAG